MNTNDLFIEKNIIMESLSCDCIDSLDYLYEAILLEDSMSWFDRLKKNMISFFKKHKKDEKDVKKIFTDKTKHDIEIKIYDYYDMLDAIRNINDLIYQLNVTFLHLDMENNNNYGYTEEITATARIKDLSDTSIDNKVRSFFIKGNEKINTTIGKLDEKVAESYLIKAEKYFNGIDKHKDEVKKMLLNDNDKLEKGIEDGRITKKEAVDFKKIRAYHVSILEKIFLKEMKYIKQGFIDYSAILKKGNGTIDNIKKGD